ncbi:MAG: NAD-dependent epimerase/dehydratase family protein, partial [Gammaproteobacteria bacterium]
MGQASRYRSPAGRALRGGARKARNPRPACRRARGAGRHRGLELSGLRVIVTGAGGFLGRHLCRALDAAGHQVVPLSRRPGPGMVTVEDYRHAPGGDILIHLAQEPDRARFNAGGAEAANTAVAMLESLLQGPWERVVYASSAAVYGDTGARPARVSSVVDAGDDYNRCKLACEARVLDRGGVAARLANLYG